MSAWDCRVSYAARPWRTTVSDPRAICPLDHVNRQFNAPRPNALWVR